MLLLFPHFACVSSVVHIDFHGVTQGDVLCQLHLVPEVMFVGFEFARDCCRELWVSWQNAMLIFSDIRLCHLLITSKSSPRQFHHQIIMWPLPPTIQGLTCCTWSRLLNCRCQDSAWYNAPCIVLQQDFWSTRGCPFSQGWCLVDLHIMFLCMSSTLIARFMGPTWGPSGADRTQVGPMLAPWTWLSGYLWCF